MAAPVPVPPRFDDAAHARATLGQSLHANTPADHAKVAAAVVDQYPSMVCAQLPSMTAPPDEV